MHRMSIGLASWRNSSASKRSGAGGPLEGTAEAAEGKSGSRPWASPLWVPDNRLSGSDNADDALSSMLRISYAGPIGCYER
jgi:hypothetical protein